MKTFTFTLSLLAALLGCARHTANRAVPALAPVAVVGEPSTAARENLSAFLSASDLGRLMQIPIATHLGEWKNLGPRSFGGKAYDVAVSPRDPNVVLAAYSYRGGLWQTRDGGETWRCVIDRRRNPSIASVVFHPSDQNLVYAGLGSVEQPYNVDSGVMKSVDGGESWTLIGPVQSGLSVFRILLHPTNRGTIYIATNAGVFKSIDDGQTWQNLLAWRSDTLHRDMPEMAMSPSNPSVLLVSHFTIGLLRSSDAGQNWTRVDTGWNQGYPATVMAWSSSLPNIVYAERPGGIDLEGMDFYKSADSGATWAAVGKSARPHQGRWDMSMAVDPRNSERVLVGNVGTEISSDGLRSVATVPQEPHADNLRIVFAPSNPNIVFSANDGGIWKSTDSGSYWYRFDYGVESTHVVHAAIHPPSNRVFVSVGDYNRGPMRSPRGIWERLNNGVEFDRFFLNPLNATELWTGGDKPIQWTEGFRGPWTLANPPTDELRRYFFPIAVHPSLASTVYLGLVRLWRTDDRGKSWIPLGSTSFAGSVFEVAVAPSDPSVIYVSTDARPYLYRSQDNGVTWQSLSLGLQLGKNRPYIDPRDSKRVFFGSDHGPWVSSDGGATGRPVTGNLPVMQGYYLLPDRIKPGRLFYAADPGVWVTEDFGESWRRLGRELTLTEVTQLQQLGDRLYAATRQGIWQFDIEPASCADMVELAPKYLVTGPEGLSTRIDVTSTPTCEWEPRTASSWVQASRSDRQSGSGFVRVTLPVNTGVRRQATIEIGGRSFLIVQSGTDSRYPKQGDEISLVSVETGLCFQGDFNMFATTCSDTNIDQKLVVRGVGSNSFQMSQKKLLRCLESSSQDPIPGEDLVGRALCKDDEGRRFRFEGGQSGNWRIIHQRSNYCISARGKTLTSEFCDGTISQLFRFSARASAADGGPQIAPAGGVLDAASFRPGIARGGWGSVFGTSLASKSRTWSESDFVSGKMPTALDGVRVLVNGIAAPVYFISPGQINFQAPMEAELGENLIQVESDGVLTPPVPVEVFRHLPSLYTWVAGTRTLPVVFGSDGTLIGPPGSVAALTTRQAKPGEVVVVYGSGFGETKDLRETGKALARSSELLDPAALLVLVGDEPCKLLYGGLISPGVYQFNIQLPQALRSGTSRLELNYWGSRTQADLAIPIE